MRRPRVTLAFRIFLGAAIVVATVLGGTVALTSIAASRTAGAAAARGLSAARQLVDAYLAGREQSLANGALVFAQNAAFRSLVIQKTHGDVLDQALEAVEQIGAGWVQITDESGIRLAKSDEPTAAADPLSGSSLISGALEGRITTGFGLTGDTAIFQAVAVPIPSAGVLMATRAVDSSLVAAVREGSASDIVFYAIDTAGIARIAASSLPRDTALDAAVRRYVASHPAPASDDSTRGRRAPEAPVEITLGGERYVASGTPLYSAGGDALGGYLAFRSRDAEMAPFLTLRRRIILAGALGLIVASALSYLIARGIARPVRALAAAARKASQGDYAAPVPGGGSDEIGQLAQAFRVLLADLRDKQALVDLLTVKGEGAPRTSQEAPIAAVVSPSASMIVPGFILARRYEIVEIIGDGGMGRVFKAADRELGEIIAIKTLKPEIISEDPTAIERFKTEIRLTRRISHRNVVRTYDFGEEDGLYFITMEFVEGTPLDRLLDARRRLPIAATLAIAKQLSRALEVAHEQNVIHRDIKPANLMLSPDGVLKVMDFGIARLVQRTSGMTRTGVIVGTLEYMAPEQLLGDEVDVRADLYAVGVVMYECLTGQHPFNASSYHLLVGKMMSETPRPPDTLEADVPRPLSELVLRTLARDRDARPATATELYEALAALG